MATEVDRRESAKKTWQNIKPRRTEAMPKNTLFGCDLEIHDKANISDIDLKAFDLQEEAARRSTQKRYKSNALPDYLRNKLPGNEGLASRKEAVKRQAEEVRKANDSLHSLEAQSKYFAFRTPRLAQKPDFSWKADQWITEKDIEHAADMNKVGLNPSGSFDRAQYQAKRPTHQYSLIGDPVQLGMHFPQRESPKGKDSHCARAKPCGPNTVPRAAYMRHSAHQTERSPKFVVNLPPNIQHSFGTKVCVDVLSDSDKVKNTLNRQREIETPTQRYRVGLTPGTEPLAVDSDPGYDSLSNVLRQNVFPGYTDNHKKSLSKSVYTDDVHKRRYPDPEEYRYQRDQLSTWNERNVLQMRQKKQWEEYEDSRPKLNPNWDRDAKRPPPPKPVEQNKPKVKAKPRKTKGADNKQTNNEFEDVIFKTPPLTPPPKREEIKVEAYNRDDDFWEFYNQSAPK